MKQSDQSFEEDSLDLIERMLNLMDERGLLELEVEREGLKIRLRKEGKSPMVPSVEYIAPAPVQSSPAAAGAPAADANAASANQQVIVSPMVGTFYRSPAPDAPAFVEEGQEIEEGQVVCIVEAMKLMNEIKAELSGRVVKIMVKNGDPVEFGQALFAIEPA